MPEIKAGAENGAETERHSKEEPRFGDANQRHQNKAEDDEQTDGMPGPLTAAEKTEGYNMRVLARRRSS